MYSVCTQVRTDVALVLLTELYIASCTDETDFHSRSAKLCRIVALESV